MNQEKIGQLIREIRKKNNYTQQQFAKKYGVTYQAVSKWENGINLPDIQILKAICDDNNLNLDNLLNSKVKKKKIKLAILGTILLITILISCYYLFFRPDHNFEFKKISTTCENFELYGSMAYSSNKTSIYISNIIYCGEKNLDTYQSIKCTLYENKVNGKSEIATYEATDKNITLEEFLKKVNFNIDHYSKDCEMYKENKLVVEITAINNSNETTTYELPLILEDNC